LDASALAGMFTVHVAAASVLANALVPSMPDGGRIVLLGSRTSTGSPGKSQYAATKAALMGLGRTWAQELAPRGITVNVLSPGPTDTPMLNDPGRAAAPVKVPALGALVDPEDAAALAAFLLGPHGKSITGQNYVICGGASLSRPPPPTTAFNALSLKVAFRETLSLSRDHRQTLGATSAVTRNN
jgi:NAD(P)-dependent dehydrogenase (short-subunit alcohol dehydrogenase family)